MRSLLTLNVIIKPVLNIYFQITIENYRIISNK